MNKVEEEKQIVTGAVLTMAEIPQQLNIANLKTLLSKDMEMMTQLFKQVARNESWRQQE